jgi:hypothetical protein
LPPWAKAAADKKQIRKIDVKSTSVILLIGMRLWIICPNFKFFIRPSRKITRPLKKESARKKAPERKRQKESESKLAKEKQRAKSKIVDFFYLKLLMPTSPKEHFAGRSKKKNRIIEILASKSNLSRYQGQKPTNPGKPTKTLIIGLY